MSNTSYACIAVPTEKMVGELKVLADKAGAALAKSANATREFFRAYPDAVGNPEECQGILSYLPNMGDFGRLKKDGNRFIQTFLGLETALRKGTAEIRNGQVLWRGQSYPHKYCLFGIAICNAARKQAAKKPDSATPVPKKATRAELSSLISSLVALCGEHSIKDDHRYKLLVDKWKAMEV